MSLRRRLRPFALAVCVALAAALAGMPADAVEAPPGSKNFTPPGYVPNYFSNESGPFHGGATARAAQPGPGRVFAVPAPRRRAAAASSRHARHHAGRAAPARGRLRLARGKASANRHVVHAHAVRGGSARSAHVSNRTVAAPSRGAAGAGRRVARAGR